MKGESLLYGHSMAAAPPVCKQNTVELLWQDSVPTLHSSSSNERMMLKPLTSFTPSYTKLHTCTQHLHTLIGSLYTMPTLHSSNPFPQSPSHTHFCRSAHRSSECIIAYCLLNSLCTMPTLHSSSIDERMMSKRAAMLGGPMYACVHTHARRHTICAVSLVSQHISS